MTDLDIESQNLARIFEVRPDADEIIVPNLPDSSMYGGMFLSRVVVQGISPEHFRDIARGSLDPFTSIVKPVADSPGSFLVNTEEMPDLSAFGESYDKPSGRTVRIEIGGYTVRPFFEGL